MFESIFAATTDSALSFPGMFYALGAAIIMGIFISIVYIKTHKDQLPSQGFALTLAILPAVITIIILLVGNSVARAFSLAGAFSIIRFRSAPGEPKDITYILFSMAVGLSCGMGYLLYGAAVVLILCALVVILETMNFGKVDNSRKLLKITVPENLDYKNAFDGVLKKYTQNYKLLRIKTADLGSLYELNYSIVCKDDVDEKAFIDDLRCRNGNLNITLVLDVPHTDFQG